VRVTGRGSIEGKKRLVEGTEHVKKTGIYRQLRTRKKNPFRGPKKRNDRREQDSVWEWGEEGTEGGRRFA